MSHLDISVLHRTRRNEASIALANEGAGASKIKLYDAAGGTLLGVRTLGDPCGAIVADTGRIQLAQATADDLVSASGSAGYAEWVNGDGVVIATAQPQGDFAINHTGDPSQHRLAQHQRLWV